MSEIKIKKTLLKNKNEQKSAFDATCRSARRKLMQPKQKTDRENANKCMMKILCAKHTLHHMQLTPSVPLT